MLFATLSAYVTDFSILSTLETVLSGSQQLRKELQIALSSIPAHPYERLKSEYLGQEFSPVKIDDICIKEDFCAKTCLASICAISINMNQNVMSHFYSVTSQDLSAMNCNAFIQLSTTDCGEQFIVNPKRSAGYLGFLETIKRMPIDLIEKDPVQTAKKLISHYIDVMS